MIKSARKRQRLTQYQLAIRLGVTRSYISKLENRSHDVNPGIRQIVSIAKVLKVDSHKLASWFIEIYECEFAEEIGGIAS